MTENEDNSHRIVNNKSVEEFKSNNKIYKRIKLILFFKNFKIIKNN